VEKVYLGLTVPFGAYVRDLNQLAGLQAITIRLDEKKGRRNEFLISVRPEWATEITETQFYRELDKLPAAKTRLYVSVE
jgi:hypothetical protein